MTPTKDKLVTTGFAIYISKKPGHNKLISIMNVHESRVNADLQKARAKRIVKCWNNHDRLLRACKNASAIKDLWLIGGDVSEEHKEEAQALSYMQQELEQAIVEAAKNE